MSFVAQNMTSVTLALAATLLLFACTPTKKGSDSNEKRYSLKGKVISIDKQSQIVNVEAEAIPGFMEAMTMPYKVKPGNTLDQLSQGDSISADLIVHADEYWLENVKVAQHSSPPAPKVTKVTFPPSLSRTMWHALRQNSRYEN